MKSLLGKVGVIPIGLVIFGYAEVWGADWKFYTNGVYGDYFYDAEAITRPSKGIVRVWVKVEYSLRGAHEMIRELGKEYKNINYAKVLHEINCSDRKWRTLSLTRYSKEGEVINSSSREGEWGRIFPESLGEALYKWVCNFD